MMHLNETQAQALAAFIGRVRPDWDHPGIMAALKKAAPLGSGAAVGAALCKLAENMELRTPALLADPGSHWAGTTVASRQPPSMCPEHPAEKAGACQQCAAAALADPDAIRAKADAVRAALRSAPRPKVAAEPARPATDLAAARARTDQDHA